MDANALKARITRRVGMEQPLLEAMGIREEAFLTIIYNALATQPKLADCTPESLDKAIMDCINARLLPDGVEAAIVPYGAGAQFVIMVAGRVKLAHQATRGLTIRSRVVYREDDWEYSEGLRPVLEHKPNPAASRTDADIIAAYAIALIPQSIDPAYEVALRPDLDRAQGWSRGTSGPWKSHYPEMAANVPLKRLLKRLPMPAGFGWGVGYDDDYESPVVVPTAPVDEPAPLPEPVVAPPETAEAAPF